MKIYEKGELERLWWFAGERIRILSDRDEKGVVSNHLVGVTQCPYRRGNGLSAGTASSGFGEIAGKV